MKTRFSISLFFFCAMLALEKSFAQERIIDSLKSVLQLAKEDTGKVVLFRQIGLKMLSTNPDSSILYSKQGIILAKKLGFKREEAHLLDNVGYGNMTKGNYEEAIANHIEALKLHEEVGDEIGRTRSLQGIGYIYDSQKNINKALEYYQQALTILTREKNAKGISTAEHLVAIIYLEQTKYREALNLFFKNRSYYENAGRVADYYKYTSIAYRELGQLDSAFYSSERALQGFKRINDETQYADVLIETSKIYIRKNDYQKAIELCSESFSIAKQLNVRAIVQDASKLLSDCYAKTSDFEHAYKYQTIYVHYRDSLATGAQVSQIEAKYKKEQADIIAKQEKEKQQLIIYGIAGILLIVIVFSVFLLNRYKITQKQKKIIEKQKVQVDKAFEKLNDKNKEVMDSIYYARRIQRALLTSEKYIARNLSKLIKKN